MKSGRRIKDMTIQDVIRILVYRPYDFDMSVMVDKEERIHIKTDHWIVILDHNTGDFSFSGELHKYYEVDMIESIRDCFGDIYSVFNVIYDSVPADTWVEIDNSDAGLDIVKVEEKRASSERVLQYKRDYYWKNKERISKRQKEYYQKKKNGLA